MVEAVLPMVQRQGHTTPPLEFTIDIAYTIQANTPPPFVIIGIAFVYIYTVFCRYTHVTWIAFIYTPVIHILFQWFYSVSMIYCYV